MGDIHESARIEGQSLVTGDLTRIGPGAIVRDSCIHNAVIQDGAQVIDSVVIDGDVSWSETIRSDFEAKWTACYRRTARIGKDAVVNGSVLTSCDVGEHASISNTTSWNTLYGKFCSVDTAQCDGSVIGDCSVVEGPVEVGGSWVGHHARLDRLACHNGVYSNDFCVVEFDDKEARLTVREVLDLPHVSRYGMNLICSCNSGLIPPQPDGVFASFGRPDTGWGRFGNIILHMGKNRFDPCCWIGGWTKVVGVPCQTVFQSYSDLLTKNTSTHLLPFCVAGTDATTVFGCSMPGERYDGDTYKQRIPGWPFIYAPEAVQAMVRRIHAVSGKEVADRVVELTLRNALECIRYLAHQKGVRLDGAPARGWGGWLVQSRAKIQAMLDARLWTFSDGEPTAWTVRDGRMVPRDPATLLAIAPDALDKQRTEEDLLACDHETIPRQLGPDKAELASTTRETSISPEARVDPRVFVGPGVQILGKSVVEEGAWLYRTVVKDSRVGKNVKALRSCLINSTIENVPEINTCGIYGSTLKSRFGCKGARVRNSTISEVGRLDPFSSLTGCTIEAGASFGGVAESVHTRSSLLLAHPQGYARHVVSVPSVIEVDGREVSLTGPAIIGGGGRVLGTAEKPALLECFFAGSNSIIREGAYVGLGCFVLDGLDAGEGLLPFTLSNGPGPSQDQLAAVLFRHASLIISQVICPMYHGADPALRPFVGHLITAKIRESIRAIEWIQALRDRGQDWDESSPYAKYTNLRHYTTNQLAMGLQGFTTARADGRWKMAFVDGELRFSGGGRWVIDDGDAHWRAA